MSEQAWTKGNIELLNSEFHCTIKIGDAVISAPYQPPYGRGECTRWRADGKRIVDCWNACDGIPNPAEFVRAARELAEAADARCEDDTMANEMALVDALSAFRAAGGGQ